MITPIEHTARIIEVLPKAEAIRIENSGHLGIIEHMTSLIAPWTGCPGTRLVSVRERVRFELPRSDPLRASFAA
jgi:hypothetical protein